MSDIRRKLGDEIKLPTEAACRSLRHLLRETTHEIHQRLHLHDGFAAIQDETIDRSAYQNLIVRLYGFHLPFELAAGFERERSGRLEEDLRALGLDPGDRAVPICRHLPRLDSTERRLGALYVVEGAALGGRELAKGLNGLLGATGTEGRRFFMGRGPGTAQGWRDYLALLSAASTEPSAQAEVISAAVETFAVFEDWLSGWKVINHA